MKSEFQLPRDLIFNTGKIADPSAFARANDAEAAERDEAPFVRFDDYKAWLAESLVALRRERQSRDGG